MHLLGQAAPDCDWQDRRSARGCRERAVFVLWIRDVKTGRMQGESLFGCRSHAADMKNGLFAMAIEMTRVDKMPRRVTVADIALLREQQRKGLQPHAPDMLGGPKLVIPSKA